MSSISEMMKKVDVKKAVKQVKNTSKADSNDSKQSKNQRTLYSYFVEKANDLIESLLASAIEGATDISLLGFQASDLASILYGDEGTVDETDSQKKAARKAMRNLQGNIILSRRNWALARTQDTGGSNLSTYYAIPLDGLPDDARAFVVDLFSQFAMHSIPADGILTSQKKWGDTVNKRWTVKTDNKPIVTPPNPATK